jgi:hypothetical protein
MAMSQAFGWRADCGRLRGSPLAIRLTMKGQRCEGQEELR